MTKNKINEILENRVFPVRMREKVRMSTINGLVNEDELLGLKRLNVCNALTYITKELVTSQQEYPKDGYSDVNLRMECVVMSMADFLELNRLLNNE
jgi:hypothetical protein